MNVKQDGFEWIEKYLSICAEESEFVECGKSANIFTLDKIAA